MGTFITAPNPDEMTFEQLLAYQRRNTTSPENISRTYFFYHHGMKHNRSLSPIFDALETAFYERDWKLFQATKTHLAKKLATMKGDWKIGDFLLNYMSEGRKGDLNYYKKIPLTEETFSSITSWESECGW